MRRSLVMGNWKMNGSLAANQVLLEALLAKWQGVHKAEVAVAPVSLHLAQVGQLLSGSNIQLAAQDASAHASGAFTGEVAAAMLSELDCRYVIVGHSERRQYHAESSELVAKKAKAVLAEGMVPVVCVGETLSERDAGQTLAVISEQLSPVIALFGASLAQIVVAYEPVWAIGTGKTATPEQAQAVHAFIRDQLGAAGEQVRILYGGSVKPANAEALFAKTDIDGALVGGAALKADDFYAICRAAD
ncbi:triose-phosphate isomerase [Simiduia agarivorans]|uniref:Triosephosphate isomerase n=1 Tax=Simiduia agarivorans (strain DSM 21679 / JCM 13881 / BCRC 17597 / SA1) TaxID=1117647 RepID=K4KKW1_SIMAS|nr:triose-phosphate isomerase [Simiduia agarivorans]AFU98668.1 triosephosphate isomerase [Simiduia agarivorans SA1 = DSM 21679]